MKCAGAATAAPFAGILDILVAVAQLVESRIVIPVVVGSSPISHPSIHRKTLLFIR